MPHPDFLFAPDRAGQENERIYEEDPVQAGLAPRTGK